MIGNDVVDLLDPDAQPGARHPRFDERVFAPEEREVLARSGVPDRLRWILWSAKEAAYKVARKLDGRCVFSPVRFVVSLDATLRGFVRHGGRRFPVCVAESAGVVHAVATSDEISPERLCSGLRELREPGAATAPGRAARELALGAIGRELDVAAGDLAVAREGRVPVLEVQGERADADLSLSHHGRWVAFACELPEPRESAA